MYPDQNHILEPVSPNLLYCLSVLLVACIYTISFLFGCGPFELNLQTILAVPSLVLNAHLQL